MKMKPRAYSYDFRSRMKQLVDTNGSVFAYAFDGEGNRTKQELNDCLETRFVYDGNNVVLELNANNEPVQAYVNNLRIDQPVERISFINGIPRQRRTFHRDALGSVVGLSDENGALVQSYDYAAFGAIRTQSGADLNRITYTAREALGDSAGLYYYRFRTYNPALGRFLAEDLLGFIDGPNRYIYVRNNPLRWIDPFGLASICETLDDAGRAAIADALARAGTGPNEWGGEIYRSGSGYTYNIGEGTFGDYTPKIWIINNSHYYTKNKDGKLVPLEGGFHIHPGGLLSPGEKDEDSVRQLGKPHYLGTEDGITTVRGNFRG